MVAPFHSSKMEFLATEPTGRSLNGSAQPHTTVPSQVRTKVSKAQLQKKDMRLPGIRPVGASKEKTVLTTTRCRNRLPTIASIVVMIVWLSFVGAVDSVFAQKPSFSAPDVVLSGVPFTVKGKYTGPAAKLQFVVAGQSPVEGRSNGDGEFESPELTIPDAGSRLLVVKSSNQSSETKARTLRLQVLPGWISLAPPLLAILLTLYLRQVVPSLLCAIFIGGTLTAGYSLTGGFIRTIDQYIVGALADRDHASIVVFSLLLGGLVGMISRSGGTHGIVERLSTFATKASHGQVATWLMGIAIFFDDYANTLIVGNTMRPVTDRLRISREKLSYIVDSTSAPVASLFISTWIGYEVGLIGDTFKATGIELDPLQTFWATVPYRYYPILALFMVLATGAMNRDFGPMLKAERRARQGKGVLREGAEPALDADAPELQPKPGVPHRWQNAAIPIAILIFSTMTGLIWSGYTALSNAGEVHFTLEDLLSNANSYQVLLGASLFSLLATTLLLCVQKILTLEEAIEASISGFRSMVMAIVILVLAWSIGDVCKDLHTANYVVSLLSNRLNPIFLPGLVFLFSAFVSFATGTSWATMAIFMPLTIPLAVRVSEAAGLPPGAAETILIAAISSVLAGSVFGDHCSPISDTTILSSMASAADHLDHVKTQLPYAVFIALISVSFGTCSLYFDLGPWSVILIGVALVVGVLLVFGESPSRGVGADE